jgi:hypothetical protein
MPGTKFSKKMSPESAEEKLEMENVPYRSAVGSLMYLMVSTRPDLAAAVGMFSRFCQNPRKEHWEGVKRILRYIKGTRSHGLVFTRGRSLELKGYTDSDWGGCPDTGRSTGGYVFLLGGAAISWSSQRQKSSALSSCEAEYMAACGAAKEAIWTKEMLHQLGHPKEEPVKILSDSESAMNLMKNPVLHQKTKHIGIQFHFVRELIEKGDVSFSYCKRDFMVADSLTKAVSRVKVEFCRTMMGIQQV